MWYMTVHTPGQAFWALSEGQAFPGNLNLPLNKREGTYIRHVSLHETGTISEELN